MCHEGIPGHVMAGDIQVRQKGIPKFRRACGYVAFNEGWALYSEALCKEMGAYPDVAADFMRLDAELFRAARLVVDTGIHAQGWTEEQAIDYMIKTGTLSPDEARSEVQPLHHPSRPGDGLQDRNAQDHGASPEGARRPGIEVRHQGLRRSHHQQRLPAAAGARAAGGRVDCLAQLRLVSMDDLIVDLRPRFGTGSFTRS